MTISEAVYNTNGGSGDLEKSDFALSVSSGVATLSSGTPTSISKSGNVYTLGFSLSGTPDGDEILKVVPVDDGIYDAVGNEASTVQNNNTKNLNDQTKPVIGLIKFANNNSFLDIKFSVGVYSSSNGSGAIETSDFSLELLKNNGTLDNASIKSVKKDDNDNESSASSLSGGEQIVRLFLNLSGTANGSETISINPIDGNSIFDLAGNAAEAIQSNNSANLNDLIPPTVTFNPGDNSTEIPLNSSITLTFSEAIRRIDDSEINNNNVSTLLVLKDNDANGSEISFDATINTNKKLIIIDPLNDFSFSQKIYVAISGVEDNGGNTISNSSSIIFTVVSNVVPTANKQTITLDEDTVANILLIGNDKESSDLKYSYSLPMFGSLSGTAPNLIYKPNSNFFGPDSFKFVVNDGLVDSDSALISIIVNSINDKPSGFDLMSPVDQFEIIITNNNVDNSKVSFSWHESIDIDMDKLNYIFHYQFEMKKNNDEKFQLDYDTTINKTSVDFIYRKFLKELDSFLGTRGQITWSVDVTDGIDTIINNEERIIKVEGKYAALSTNEDKVLPQKYILYQNYPNPFNPITSIKYDLPIETRVTIEIYNIIGNKITTLIDKNMDAGSHIVRWNSTDRNSVKIPSGIYFYHIKTNEFIKTKKMILLK